MLSMYHFLFFVLLALMTLSESWVMHIRSRDSTRLVLDASPDVDWKTNETWSQKQMRSLWEREPHKIVTSHVRGMISRQVVTSTIGSLETPNSTIVDQSMLLRPFETSVEFQNNSFGRFYNGSFPAVDSRNETSFFRSRQLRKKTSYRLDFAYDGTQFTGWQRQKIQDF